MSLVSHMTKWHDNLRPVKLFLFALSGATCLFTAAKYEEIDPPEVKSIAQMMELGSNKILEKELRHAKKPHLAFECSHYAQTAEHFCKNV